MIEARRLPTSSRVPLSSLLHAFEDPAAFVTTDGDLLSMNPAWRIHEIAERLVDVGRTPVMLAEEQVHVGVSVGVARSCPGDDLDSLIDRADQAMYRAKRAGGGRVEVAGDS